MDELHLLRATRNTTGSVPPAVLAAGREKLMQRAAEESLPETVPVLHPRRPWRRTLFASAAAAALIAALVAVDVVGSGERPGATAEAAEVLNDAAAATIITSDPVLAPGQYLPIDTEEVDTTATVTPEGEEFAWLTSRGHQIYIPADRTGEWVWTRAPSKPVQFFDDASRQEAERVGALTTSGSTELERAPGGKFSGVEQSVLFEVPLGQAVENAPRDPRKLLDVLYEGGAGGGRTQDEEALVRIAETLRTGAIPADLRAALYQAAALIPGVTVVDREATLDGRTGVSLGIGSPEQGFREEIIIDPDTGLMIGERSVVLKDGNIFPAGTAVGWTAVTTSVVDSAP